MAQPIEKLLDCALEDLPRHDALAAAALSPERIGDETYMDLPELGISLVLRNGRSVSTVHLLSKSYQDSAGFKGELPFGLRFEMTRHDVRNALGRPGSFSDGGEVEFLGPHLPWDNFLLGPLVVHVEYRPTGAGKDEIAMVTLSRNSQTSPQDRQH